MLPDHPDTLTDYHRLKQIQKGSKQALETTAMNAMWDAIDNGATRVEAEKVFFNHFNKVAMENKDKMAFPFYEPGTGFGSVSEGLTKRELIAALALQGLLANPDYNCPSRPKEIVTTMNTAKAAMHYADALLTELSKP